MRLGAALLVAAALTAPAAAGESESFHDRLAALSAPRLVGEPHAVAGLTFTSGHTTFTLDGAAQTVSAGGETVGFAFAGGGTASIALQRGPFYQANVTNLKENLGEAPTEAGTWAHEFDRALFLTNRLPTGLDTGEAAGGDELTELAEVVDAVLDRWQQTPYQGLDHVLAWQLLAEPRGESALVLLEGGGRDAFFQHDGEAGEDRFGLWKKARGIDALYVEGLVYQPVDFDPRLRPEPPIVQTAIDVELVSTDNEQLRERTTTTLVAGRSGLGVVALALINGRDERYRPWDERSDPFTVTSVVDGNGEALEFSHKYDELLVRMPHPLRQGEVVTLTVLAEGRLLKNYRGDSYRVLGNMAWYPQLDVTATHATFHSVVKVADPWIAIGCGRNIRRWQEEGLNCLETREERRIAFPLLVVGKFEEHAEEKAEYVLKVYSYVMSKERGAKNLMRNGLAILDFYSNGMHDYPYGELEVVEIPYFRHFFWQAPAGVVEITSEGLNPAGGSSERDALIRRYASKGQNARYAHEIAHQWFGNLVPWGADHDNWLSESFAEYLSYMFMLDGAKDKRKAKAQFAAWEADVRECADTSSIYGATALQWGGNGRCSTQLLYGKGPYVLHALREDMGEENFAKMLYFLTAQAAKKEMKVITEDVILFANHLTGRDYHDWFDRYVYGTEVPEVKR